MLSPLVKWLRRHNEVSCRAYSLMSTEDMEPTDPIAASFWRSLWVSSKREFPRADFRRDICLWNLLLETNDSYCCLRSDSNCKELTPGVKALSSATISWCFWFNSNLVGGLEFEATKAVILPMYSPLAFSIIRAAVFVSMVFPVFQEHPMLISDNMTRACQENNQEWRNQRNFILIRNPRDMSSKFLQSCSQVVTNPCPLISWHTLDMIVYAEIIRTLAIWSLIINERVDCIGISIWLSQLPWQIIISAIVG